MTKIKDNISFRVDELDVDPALLRIPPMGLSSARASMVKHHFRLEVPANLLCLVGKEDWEAYAAKCKAEDEKHGGPDADDWVAIANYPPLHRVIADQEELNLLFGQGGSLLQLVMPKLLGLVDSPKQKKADPDCFYWDSWDVELSGENILWEGTCYSMKKGVL